jgi:hypothetical protein
MFDIECCSSLSAVVRLRLPSGIHFRIIRSDLDDIDYLRLARMRRKKF